MAKPTNEALWATTGTKVEPSLGVKQAGWAPTQKPPAQWLNWWMNAVYLWMVWLDAFESTAHTWTGGNQTFSTGLQVTGGTFGIGGSVSAVTVTPDAVFIADVEVDTDLSCFGTSFLHIINVDAIATFTGVASFQDDVEFQQQMAISFPITYVGSNPATPATARDKRIEAANVVAVRARCTMNNTTSNRVVAGYNVTSVIETLGTGVVTVIFATAMADANYSLNFFNEDAAVAIAFGDTRQYVILSRSTTGFTFQVYNLHGSTATALLAGTLSGDKYSFDVVGDR